jgi:SP family galactose:H+ symporter-like MFS transporter
MQLNSKEKLISNLTTLQQEIITSSILLGALIGSSFGGLLSDWIGRKLSITIMSCISFLSALFCAFSPTFIIFSILRMILGIGIGLCTVVCPLYVSEVSPSKKRGFLGTFFQLSITFSILIAYVVGYFILGIQYDWRIMSGLGAIPSIFLIVISIFWIEESYQWLKSKQLQENFFLDKSTKKSSFNRIINIFLSPQNRKPFFLGIIFSIILQLTGINTIIYYAPKVFSASGSNKNISYLATIGVGAWNFITTLIAIFTVDRFGRRILYLIGTLLCILSTLMLGFIYKFIENEKIITIMAIIGISLFIAGFECGPGPLFFVLVNEIFESKDRGTAGAFMNFLQWSFNLALSLSFLTLIDTIGLPFTYWIFTGIGISGWIIVFLLLPETKGKDFDEIWNIIHQKSSSITEEQH